MQAPVDSTQTLPVIFLPNVFSSRKPMTTIHSGSVIVVVRQALHKLQQMGVDPIENGEIPLGTKPGNFEIASRSISAHRTGCKSHRKPLQCGPSIAIAFVCALQSMTSPADPFLVEFNFPGLP